MAGKDRQATNDLTDRMAALKTKPHEFGFYPALRLIECFHKERPRLGTSKRPADDAIRLGQEPALTFEAASLTDFEPGTDGNPHRLTVRLLGLLGPNGPLPLHFTEYARNRRRDYGDRTFARFLDMFHHRMLSLFYRAWANNEPTIGFDRPESDRFPYYVGALAGLGMETLLKRDGISDKTKLFYCGRLSGQTRCAEGLQAILTDYFDISAGIEEFVGDWMQLSQEHISRLGVDKTVSTLGESIVLGSKVWSAQHKFRIHLGPLYFDDYARFLPAGDRIGRLVPLVRNYIGDELAWDVCLILKRKDVPAVCLDGSFRLGWTTWLGERRQPADPADLVLDALKWVNRESGNAPV